MLSGGRRRGRSARFHDIPSDYDAGALLDELIKLKILAVKTCDLIAMLVPAESARAESEPLKSEARVTQDAGGAPRM